MLQVINLISFHGSLVLVCGRCCCALWRAPNLHPNGSRSHRWGVRRLRSRGDRGIVDFTLPRISLVVEPLESAIQRARNFLFRSHWSLRGCRNDCILPAFSKRRPALVGSSYFSWRRRDYGNRRHFVFSRTAVVAENSRCCVRYHWFVFAAQIEIGFMFIS